MKMHIHLQFHGAPQLRHEGVSHPFLICTLGMKVLAGLPSRHKDENNNIGAGFPFWGREKEEEERRRRKGGGGTVLIFIQLVCPA